MVVWGGVAGEVEGCGEDSDLVPRPSRFGLLKYTSIQPQHYHYSMGAIFPKSPRVIEIKFG